MKAEMKAAFEYWHDTNKKTVDPHDVVEWTLDYLRSQQEPVATGIGPGDWTRQVSTPLRPGAKLYLDPVEEMDSKLVGIISEFVEEHGIACPEVIYQNDNVSAESYSLIRKLVDVVGYHDDPEWKWD